jgi:S-formylglutathione hydrolase
MAALRTLSAHACFGGVQGFYEHESDVIGLPMRFGVYLPPQAKNGPVPALFFLAGLTCTEEAFAIKAGAQRMAAELGVAIITPDTSPRGANIPGESEHWDFGLAAGFYLDATQEPWSRHWKMGSYIAHELRALVVAEFPVNTRQVGIFGHSMGGHGALTLGLQFPTLFRSVSAFAPIAAPMQCPWGQKAFRGYLGANPEDWAGHDATALIQSGARTSHILIDQGLDDKFLAEQLHPHHFEQACSAAEQPLTLRRHPGYDHGYYFIASFVADHLQHHSNVLSDGMA